MPHNLTTKALADIPYMQRSQPLPMLNGQAKVKLTEKHRVSFPSIFKNPLHGLQLYLLIVSLTNSNEAEMVVPLIVTLDFWQELLNRTDAEERHLIHMNTYPIAPDSHGRILFPEPTVDIIPFGIGDDLRFIGCGNYIQIWKNETWLASPDRHVLKL